MEVIKNNKNNRTKIYITSFVILICVIAVISVIYLQSNKHGEIKEAAYNGSNYSYSISFTRFTDYESFINAKSPNIYIYDTEKELNVNNGFIAGEIQIKIADEEPGNQEEDLQNCKVELIRESGWNTGSTALYTGKPPDNTITMPFIAYDFDDSSGNIYKNAVIKIGKNEIPIELKNNK